MKDQRTEQKPQGLLLPKWLLVGQALSRPELSKGAVAVLWQLCERYNESAGAAWPSMTTLAKDAHIDRKTVQRSLARLIEHGLVEVVARGNRTQSNRYRPALAEMVGASTPLGGVLKTAQSLHKTGGNVGAPESQGRGVEVPNVGARAPMESSYQPGLEAGVDKREGLRGHSAASAASAPLTQRRYPQFWEEYPKAEDVFKAEQVIDQLLRNGEATLPALVDGARRYAASLEAQPWGREPRYIKKASNWLDGRHWLDDHKPTAPKGSQATPTAKSRGDGSDSKMPDFKKKIVRLRQKHSLLPPAAVEQLMVEIRKVLGVEVADRWLSQKNLGRQRHKHPPVDAAQEALLADIIRRYTTHSRKLKKTNSK